MDPHRPDTLVGTALLALSALAILVTSRRLFPHQYDDDCPAIVHCANIRFIDMETSNGARLGRPPKRALAGF